MASSAPEPFDEQLSKMTISEPLLRFRDINEFAAAHEKGTRHELDEERKAVHSFNNGGHIFHAFILSAPPSGLEKTGWIVRVSPHCQTHKMGCEARGLLPYIGDKCEIWFMDKCNFEKKCETGHTCEFNAERIAERAVLSKEWDKHITFKVNIGKAGTAETLWMPTHGPLEQAVHDLSNLLPLESWAVNVEFSLRVSEATADAELAALRLLTTMEESARTPIESNVPGELSTKHEVPIEVKVFRRLVLGTPSSDTPRAGGYDLARVIPQFKHPSHIRDKAVRSKLMKIIDTFDSDQMSAFKELRHMPERTFWLPGGPGAGKTTWALGVAAVAMAGEKKTNVLYLLDVNKPLTDTAVKMIKLVKSIGLKKRIVRVYRMDCKPEAVAEENQDGGRRHPPKSEPTEADFRGQFLNEWHRHQNADSPSADSEETVQSLDEAAWEYFKAHKHQYPEIQEWLCHLDDLKRVRTKMTEDQIHAHMRDIGQFPREKEEKFQKELAGLYKDTLWGIDFVAATPVGAKVLARGYFTPQLVFFDEAEHARELSTLIPIAFFRPYVWFFLGDHRQTQPYVRTKEAAQLTVSTLARKAATGEISKQLLLNHRAHGGLEEMPSEIMYDGLLRSGIAEDKRCPASTRHLQTCLAVERLGHLSLVTEVELNSRLLLEFTDSRWVEVGKSFYNPRHLAAVELMVEKFLKDPRFTSTDGTEPGTILIIVPYRAAYIKYVNYVATLGAEEAKRVEIRTMGTVQGDEADVVFLDLVKSAATDFLDDRHRLCVSITRARQAEIILMHRGMSQKKHVHTGTGSARHVQPVWLKKIYDYCAERDLIKTITLNPRRPEHHW